MRNPRFIAAHRGGPLHLSEHRALAAWAADCAEHVMPLFAHRCPQDRRLTDAVAAARRWAQGAASVGAARSASIAAHAAARSAGDGAATAAARAAGHAAATAHMADHALQAARYAMQAVAAGSDGPAGGDRERAWQLERAPEAIRALLSPLASPSGRVRPTRT